MFSSNTSAVSGDAVFVEEVFSTYLYTGNGSARSISNGIDLATKGGMVWTRVRSTTGSNLLFDTNSGATKYLSSNTTAATTTSATTLTSFNSSGFSIGTNPGINTSAETYASWAFRKQSKFFDVVTYTGTGVARTIAHNLGSAPGCIIVKRTDSTANWQVYHRGLTSANYYLSLNLTSGENSSSAVWNGTAPTSSVFSVGTISSTNASGGSYVAYLFAHDAGGFGLDGTDNVISCGSYTGNGSATGPTVSLGWEPQFLLVKVANTANDWGIVDTMRGLPVGSDCQFLAPNATYSESATGAVSLTADGFQIATTNTLFNGSGVPYIYIAIRRGPMKVPTDGTKVFSPITGTYADNTALTTGFPVDLMIASTRSGTTNKAVVDRLRGASSTSTAGGALLYTNLTNAETTAGGEAVSWNNTSIAVGTTFGSLSSVWWNFRRAPSFFDEVCYTGTGTAGQTFNHNLGVVPELMIVKKRSATSAWTVYSKDLSNTEYLSLDTTDAKSTGTTRWNSTTPTSTVFSVGTSTSVNTSGNTYVNYLFATCAGVSKVFSYTGNGSSQTINCGFTGGARWIMIKRTDSSGDWYVWDTARGIVSGNDPHLSLNTTSAEVTSDDTIDTDSTGFIVNQLSATNVNVSSATYIGIAIA